MLAYVKKLDLKRPKLGSKTSRCVFIGYSQNNMTYRFLDLDSNEMYNSRDDEFFEILIKSDSENNTTRVYVPSTFENEIEHPRKFKLRRSNMPKKETSFGPDFLIYLI